MNSAIKNIIFWVIMAGAPLVIWAVVKSGGASSVRTLTFTEFTTEVNNGKCS